MSRRSRGILFAALAVLTTVVGLRPAPAVGASPAETSPGPRVVVRESPSDPSTARPAAASVTEAPPADAAAGPTASASTPTATFVVNYDAGFNANPAAKAAFQAAVDIWSRILVSSRPINVLASFVSQGSGTLGSAGPNLVRNFAGGLPNVWYPRAMAEAMTGQEFTDNLHPNEIEARFNSNYPSFYFGTDGHPPTDQVDFESVVLHELGHGLGVIDFLFYGDDCDGQPPGSTQACYQSGPLIFDKFTRTVGGTPLTSMPSPSQQLGTAITTPNNVVFDGVNTNAMGGPATLYTPSTYSSGSSVGHLESTLYDFTADALMTPSITRGEVSRPRLMVIGMLKDMGFPVAPSTMYQPMQPVRLLDTRTSGTPIPDNSAIDLPVTGVAGVPATGVDAVMLNVTATEADAASYFTVWPAGTTQPVASNVNFGASQTVANLVVAKVGPSGAVSIFNAHGNANAVVDINGWLPTGSSYSALTPFRILDTRGGPGIAAATPLELTVVGGGVPGNATAVMLNVTATEGTAASHFTVWPNGESQPTASNLNFTAGQTVANLVLAKVGSGGKVNIFNYAGSAHAVVDVQGWLSSTGDIVPLTPARLVDTRTSGVAIPPGGTLDLIVTGAGGVPTYGIAAVVLNVTATGATAPSHLTVWPTGAPRPTASNLNFLAGQDVPNLVVAKVGRLGKVSIFNNSGNTHLVVDVMGYSL